jgi:hypothetical protein
MQRPASSISENSSTKKELNSKVKLQIITIFTLSKKV